MAAVYVLNSTKLSYEHVRSRSLNFSNFGLKILVSNPSVKQSIFLSFSLVFRNDCSDGCNQNPKYADKNLNYLASLLNNFGDQKQPAVKRKIVEK